MDAAAQALLAYARAGFDTFDLADHYGSAEIVASMVHKAKHASYFKETLPVNTLIGGIDLIGEYLVEIEIEATLSA